MRKTILAMVAAMGLAGGFASAAMMASDNAANYASGWSLSAPNLGSGFGAWASFATNNVQPPYAGTYLDTSNKNIATSGDSWGTYANSAQPGLTPAVDLVRPFTPASGGYADPSTLGTLYNQTFSMAMSTDGVGVTTGKNVGFSLDSGQGAGAIISPVLTLEYAGGGADSMTLIDNDGTNNSAVPINFTNFNAGIMVSVAVGSNPDGLNPYTLTISPAPGNSTFTTPWVYSNFTNGPMQQVDMFTQNTDGNGYFNNLSISAESVPEPASLGLITAGAALLVARRRRA